MKKTGNETILGEHYVHTENSGWGIIVQRENEFIEIVMHIDGHCATSSVEMSFNGSKPGESLTPEDLRKIGNMFLAAAENAEMYVYGSEYIARDSKEATGIRITRAEVIEKFGENIFKEIDDYGSGYIKNHPNNDFFKIRNTEQ